MSKPQPKTVAVIPVYRDNAAAVKVLGNFTKKFVDTICLVVDGVDPKDANFHYSTPSNIHLKIINNKERKGVGYAIKQGIHFGINNGYDNIVVMAGNNKDDPREIPRLLKTLNKGYDYVQGSRFLPGGNAVNNPFFRKTFSRLYPFIWTIATSKRCTDVTNGFRAYRLSIFSNPKINIDQAWLNNYELEYYIHYKALTLGYKVTEVPVSKIYTHKHKGGYSQISPLRDWWKIVSPLIYLRLKVKN